MNKHSMNPDPATGSQAGSTPQDWRELATQAVRLVGQAGKILEQMEEFWRNGTPIHPGSLLALEFQNWGKRVMRGPLPEDHTNVLLQALKAIVEHESMGQGEKMWWFANAQAAIRKAERGQHD